MGGGPPVPRVAWSPDGLKLAAGEDEEFDSGLDLGEARAQSILSRGESTIRIWDWRAGTTLSSFVTQFGRMTDLAWHPDGRRLMAVCGFFGSTELSVWDTASGRKLAGWRPPRGESSAAFSPDGRRVVCGREPVRVRDLESGRVVLSIRDMATGCGTWSPGGDRLASLAAGGQIKVWDSVSGQELYSIPGDVRGAWWLTWSPKGELIAAVYPHATDTETRVLDTAARRKIINPGTTKDPSHEIWVAFSPEGERLLVGAQYEFPRVYDVESGNSAVTGKLRLAFVGRPVWSPDGKRFAAGSYTGRAPANVLICDAKTGEAVLPPLECEHEPRSLAWSPDGSILAVGLGRWGSYPPDQYWGRVILFSASTGKPLAASAYMDGDWTALAWSPDGKRLAASGRHELRLWDSALHPQPVAATAPAGCLGWSPDGKMLAAGSWNGTITIHDAATGSPLRVLAGHGSVQTVKWHPRMPRIASGGSDGMIRIWDSSTGQELCALESRAGIVRDLDWSPDGWRLAWAGADGSVRIWDASPADRFLKRHEGLRDGVWKLIAGYWTRQGATDAQFQDALDLLEQLRALDPEEKGLKWQTQCVEWFRATQRARAGQTAEAIALFERLTAEAPDLPDYRLQLPLALFDAGGQAQGVEILEKWVAEFPQQSEYHEVLAFLYERRAIQLCLSGQLPRAAAILRKLSRESPERPGHRSQLVRRLIAQLPPEQASGVLRKLAQEFPDAPEYREASRPRPENADAHFNAGNALRHQRKWAEAEAEYRAALRLRPDHPRANSNMGYPLVQQGKPAAAARFYAEALAAHPKLAEDTVASVRYNAACAAALAGCGQGQDSAQLDDAERARLRRQALSWLRADLNVLGQLVEKHPDQVRDVISRLTGTLVDPDFNGVRGAALAMLLEAERQAWQQLWKDYEQMLKRANR
jgi:WD40 repeat protein/tetratricopeptide (TPR) repeat protein